jgi:uncharacterized protein YdhG (YjbR/CyaY superfamily)
MKSEATNTNQYIAALPEERQLVIEKLRKVISQNLPDGFTEQMSYGMIGFVVPLSIYPKGYHCNPKLPLPFINIASQKSFIAVYHMGIYCVPKVLDWFTSEYAKNGLKLDMGKSCIRFKNMDKIPYELIGELSKKITVAEWINIAENQFNKK